MPKPTKAGHRLSRLVLGMLVVVSTGIRAQADERLRIMAANTTSGNLQSYDPGDGIRIFRGLDPDVVLIQEFNYGDNSTSDIRGFIDSAFGESFSYFREGGNEQIPNGIVSRYPILASGEWIDSEVGNRDFAWARIDIPGDRDLWAVSVHFLTSGSGVRNDQAGALVGFIQNQVPAGDFLVVGGDFNTDNFSESALGTLSAVVETDGRPKDQNGATGTNASRAKPYDQVLPDPDLSPLETAVVIAGHNPTYPEGLVFDSRVFTPLSAVPPVLAGDSGASNMQHMAVVRDFVIPTSGGPAEPGSHVSDFSASPSANSVSLSWTESATAPTADGYLIRAGTSAEFPDPTDGITETPDTDLSDGNATLLIPAGPSNAVFDGLPSSTTFHFRIFPYKEGSGINYRTAAPVPAASATTLSASDGLPPAPVIGPVLYPHAGGATITWDNAEGADAYRIDLSEEPEFATGAGSSLSENFDAAATPPATWSNGGTAEDTLASHYRSAPRCRALGSGDHLDTPSVDAPSSLSFYADASNGGNGQEAEVLYSISGGPWQSLATFAVSTTGAIETFDLTGTPALHTVSDVRFRFVSDFNTWYLDDVVIGSDPPAAFVSGYEDRSIGSATHHAVDGLDPDTTYYFRVRAENTSGTGPNSVTGNFRTASSGTPFEVWVEENAIGPADFSSDFDMDSLTDFEEYVFGTDPKTVTNPSRRVELVTEGERLQVVLRRSVAPGIVWNFQGNRSLGAIDTDLAEGTEYSNYRIDAIDRTAHVEEIRLRVNTGEDPTFFFRVKATQEP